MQNTYQVFIEKCGYDAEIDIVDGRMPCAIAVITKKQGVDHEQVFRLLGFAMW